MKNMMVELNRIYDSIICRANSLTLLRLSLGIVFGWFGVLKLVGLSPAEGLVNSLIVKMTSHQNWAHPLYIILAWMEVTIGVLFLFKKTLRYAVMLLFVQMPLTFMPLLFLSKVTFIEAPFVPTMEGQYIIKNLVIIAAGILLGQATTGSIRIERINNVQVQK